MKKPLKENILDNLIKDITNTEKNNFDDTIIAPLFEKYKKEVTIVSNLGAYDAEVIMEDAFYEALKECLSKYIVSFICKDK